MLEIEAVVIGAGVVGLACARALARAGKEVLIIERHSSFGTETSARNSEVIHAGIYYPEGSLKAQLCVLGRKLLYQFCEDYGISFKRCGKLIVASSQTQNEKLDSIIRNAKKNGVQDLEKLSQQDVRMREPEIECVSAIFSPSTGIICSHSYMLALLGDAESHGATLAINADFSFAEYVENHFILHIHQESETILKSKILINAGGLSATNIARNIQGLSPDLVPPAYLAKGSYFTLAGKAPFSHLIYPVPEQGGLGVHLTLDLAGQARFGPDVEWIEEINYEVNPDRAVKFYSAIRSYWPGLEDGALQPAYCGIRPKITAAGAGEGDFIIQDARTHGVKGLVNLFGIESPGLTSSLAIAEAVVKSLETD